MVFYSFKRKTLKTKRESISPDSKQHYAMEPMNRLSNLNGLDEFFNHV